MSHKEFKGQHELGAASPSQWSYIVRTTRVASPAEREEALAANDHNVFAFPASLLVADFLSDAGCSAASDVQWASLLRGDEAYGRNHGYYALLDAARDVFERGTENPGELVRRLIVNERNSTWAASDEELANPPCGGFANGGTHQLERPNFFMVPQQRCAEFLLFAGSRKNLGAPGADGALTIVPSNGWFDTTEAHARAAAFVPVEIPDRSIPEVPLCKVRTENHFKGNIDVQKLKALIKEKGEKAVAFVLMTMTNSREAGHPVSMANLREAASVAHSHNIPVVYDAARFAINAWAIARFENEYKGVSISKIVKEMFSYCDAFVVGCKSSSNSGGILAFRDRGMFHKRFSTPAHDIGIVIKELQILSYGNDSYGGLSGRDIMAMAVGLGQVVNPVSLERNVMQTITFAEHLDAAGVPGVSTSGSAIYIDVDKFFGRKTNPEDFMGAGIVSELIRLYGIRVAEMGPLTFQNWTGEDRPNFVRISVPQGTYSDEHVLYAVAAIAELYRQREHMPRMEIVFGKDLKLRHFQAGLKPVYPAAGKIQA